MIASPTIRNLSFCLVGFFLFFGLGFGQTTEDTTNTEVPQPCLAEPNIENLSLAFDAEIANFVSVEQEAYADVYANLSYDYLPLLSIEGTTGLVEASYIGSVTDLATGEAISANGTIHASFNWQDCAWLLLDYSF